MLLDEDQFLVRAIALDHHVPSLGFALEEKRHVNVWKNRLDELQLPTGRWLNELKAAVLRGDPEDAPFHVSWRDNEAVHEREFTLGYLKSTILTIGRGQKISYIVDTVATRDNAARIIDIARGADLLFIEASFLDSESAHATRTRHLTARHRPANWRVAPA